MESSQIATRVSAGGVVYRLNTQGETVPCVQVALILVAPKLRWQLPKGTVCLEETNEHAALREVREETGIEAELLEELRAIEYWFYSPRGGKRIRYHKFVYFYLMRYLAGNLSDHDQEVEEARWFDIAEAIEVLAYESEKDVVRMARERINQRTS